MILKTSNINLFYEKSGQGKPIILLHGNGEDHTIFQKSITILEKHFTVYAVDSRGHGNSSTVSELHYEDMAEDICEFIEKLELEKPIVYGFSDGGIVALLLSIKYPKLLSKIIVSGVNINPKGIKTYWLWLFKLMYMFSKSMLFKLMLHEPNITDGMLKRIEIPVVITAGSKDMIKKTHIKNIAQNIKTSSLTIFEGETHESYVTNSEKIGKFIVAECMNK